MKTIIFILCTLAFCLVHLSCDRNKDFLEIPGPIYESETDIFPLRVGSWWKYNVVDTLIYTFTGKKEVSQSRLTVTIVDSTILPNGLAATVWTFNQNGKIDTLFAGFRGDTLLFFKKHSKSFFIRFGFLLPLQVGKVWRLPLRDYQVLSRQEVRVPAGTFKNAFLVQEIEREGNAFGGNSYFIAPGFGIVKYRYGTFVTLSETNHVVVWNLVSFDVK
ncbi:MAG: hypothetical protein D6715_03400 [Calditrichaeota bacterium]|nr:MAG: hypothetical protein D6715_03400 [Calditrichota bacterium]